ncbi:MAG: hypothetical protein ACK5Z1_05465 [Gemmatimonadota bacterium]
MRRSVTMWTGFVTMALSPGIVPAQTGTASVLRWDVGAGTDGTSALTAIGLSRLWPVAAGGRVRVGAGARWSSWIGGSQSLATADPALIRDGRVDSLIVPVGWHSAMNVGVHLALQATDRVALGANLDVFGWSWGTSQVGTLRLLGAPVGQRVTANPQQWNRFGGGNRDRGTLASEFWVGWDVRRDVRLRAGLNHFVLEQTTPTLGTGGNTRHRRFGNAVFVSLGRLVR